MRRIPAEPQRTFLPVAGIEDPDPRRRDDAALWSTVVQDVEIRRGEWDAVDSPVDVQRAAPQARTAAPPDTRTRLEGAYEHRLGHAGRSRHEAKAVVHPVR